MLVNTAGSLARKKATFDASERENVGKGAFVNRDAKLRDSALAGSRPRNNSRREDQAVAVVKILRWC